MTGQFDRDIDIRNIPWEKYITILDHRTSMSIFYEHIENCIEEFGESPIVARILYYLYYYDRDLYYYDREDLPDFEEYGKEKAAAARMLLRLMLTASDNLKATYVRRAIYRERESHRQKEGNI